MRKIPIHTIKLSDPLQVPDLIEHRRVFNMEHCELNIFETWRKCDNVSVAYDGLVISSMMRGKKMLYFGDDAKGVDFVPGESIILPEGVNVKVDFPEADEKRPVQCAALSMDWDLVNRTLDFLNTTYPKEILWELNFSYYHFSNNQELANSLNRLISISMEDDSMKDALVDLSLKTLLVRVIQTQQLSILENNAAGHRFAPVVQYIREHLGQPISVETLCKKALMSKTVFFRLFRETFGISPVEYITRERIKLARQLLADPAMSITEICYQSGFNNVNYFTRLFKRMEGVPPSVFRQSGSKI